MYPVLEKAKNGTIENDKYEGVKIFIKHPHVVVMSNQLPDFSALTYDRFIILTVKEYQGVPRLVSTTI